MKKLTVTILFAIFIMMTSIPAFGSDNGFDDTMDIFLVRPVSLAATIVGTAIFIVSLPFSIPSKSVESTAQALVVKPFNYTFTRPIGEFRDEGTFPLREPHHSTLESDKAPSTEPQSPTVEKGPKTDGSSNQ